MVKRFEIGSRKCSRKKYWSHCYRLMLIMLDCWLQAEFTACAFIYAFFLGFAVIGTPSVCLELFGMDIMIMMVGLLQVVALSIFACPLVWNECYLWKFLCLLQAARGVGSILGPILVGKIFDVTGSYAFGNIAGCICLSCGAICMVVVMSLHSRQLTKSLLI